MPSSVFPLVQRSASGTKAAIFQSGYLILLLLIRFGIALQLSMSYLPATTPTDNTLTQLLRLCEELHVCSDAELQNQLHQMAFSRPEHLLQPVRLLLHSSLYLRQQLLADAVVAAPVSTKPSVSLLSPREREVLALLAKGYTLPRIGEKLFISTATVNNHCARMREKLGLRGRNALAEYGAGLKKE